MYLDKVSTSNSSFKQVIGTTHNHNGYGSLNPFMSSNSNLQPVGSLPNSSNPSYFSLMAPYKINQLHSNSLYQPTYLNNSPSFSNNYFPNNSNNDQNQSQYNCIKAYCNPVFLNNNQNKQLQVQIYPRAQIRTGNYTLQSPITCSNTILRPNQGLDNPINLSQSSNFCSSGYYTRPSSY